VTDTCSRALIVGGGIGGMAAAIALRRNGTAVDLIDIDPEWRVYGAGITITGPTLRAYKRLGVIDAIKTQGAVTNGATIYRFDGLFLNELDEPVLEEGLPATGGIMRPILHKIMQDQVRAHDVTVRLGLTVEAIEADGEHATARFSDGSSGTYDLVIGADGIYSTVRNLCFPNNVAPAATGQGCWRIVAPRPTDFTRNEFYFGHQNIAGITACSATEVYMWMLTKGSPQDWIPEDQQHDLLKDHMADFGGNIGIMRDAMTKDIWINYRPLEASIQPTPWNKGCVVLLGDAAHATTPHLASGAGMAVEDALVLGEELARHSVPQALAAYTARREPRCRMVVETSVAVGKLQLAGAGPDQIGALMGRALHQLAGDY
jgi:2-polyprenyl-6-methoxyphenol hydroxylase-like FAD-dependent oxidoreductase